MPFVLVLVGVVVLVAAVRGEEQDLGKLLAQDAQGFFWWIVAIVIIGAAGYVPKLRGASIAFLSLVLITMLLQNGGFFDQLTSQLSAAQSAAPNSGGTDVAAGWGAEAATSGGSSSAGVSLGASVTPFGIMPSIGLHN